jgi:tRNA(Ile)-lysidine synthase
MEFNLRKELIEKLPEEAKVAVACSAGVDSMVLLSLMVDVLGAARVKCLHYDHAVRSDSNESVIFLEKFCKDKGIDFIFERRVEIITNDSENNLRNLRYKFFESACQVNSIRYLYQAHNLNDNVETFIFRIFRGTNLSGLNSIPVKRRMGDIEICRPLLAITKEQILDYAQSNNIEYVEDYTNKEVKYQRNFIRHRILPLAKKINPKFLFNIKKLIDLRIEEEEYLLKLVEKDLVELRTLPIDLDLMRSKPKYIQRKILEELFTTNIDFVNQFLIAIEKGGFHRVNFKNDKYFTIKKKKIILETSLGD